MSRGRDSSREETTPVWVLLGILALLIVGGFLTGTYIVSLFERGDLSFDSTVLVFFVGLGCLAVALFWLWDRY